MMNKNKDIFKVSVFLGILLLLNIVKVSLSDEKSRLTILNKTDSYLHIAIEGNLYPYTPSGQDVTHETEPKSELYVQVFYSPGQGKTNTVIDSTFEISYTPGSTQTYGDYCSCEDPNSSSACSEAGEVTVPPQGGSARWEVTDEDFNNN